jgi:hypothetical protein
MNLTDLDIDRILISGSEFLATSVKAAKTSSFTNVTTGALIVTALNCGYPGNNISVVLTAGGALGIVVAASKITVTYVATVTTIADVVSAINNDIFAKLLVVASSSGTATTTLLAAHAFAEAHLIGGVGPAIEIYCGDTLCILNSTADTLISFQLPSVAAGVSLPVVYRLGSITLTTILPVSNTLPFEEFVVGTINTNNAIVDACDVVGMTSEDNAAVFEAVLDDVNMYHGAGCSVLTSKTIVAAGDHKVWHVYGAPVDWSASTTIGAFFKTDVDLSAGWTQLYWHDTVGGDVFVNVPAITKAEGWKWLEFTLGAGVRTSIDKFGFKRNRALQFKLQVDEITRFDTTEVAATANIPKTDVRILDMTGSSVLTEWTDFLVGPASKRIVFLTNQAGATHIKLLYNRY